MNEYCVQIIRSNAFISVDFYFINIILVKHYPKFISFLKES